MPSNSKKSYLERRRVISARWRKAHPGYARDWKKAHPQYMREWRKNNLEKVREQARRYERKHREYNPEQERKRLKEYSLRMIKKATDYYINVLLNRFFHTRIKYPKELIDLYRRQLLLQRKAKSLREVLDGIK